MNWGATDRIEVDSVTLECTSFGSPPGAAPTLVLLHEGLGCVALWQDFPERLAAAAGMGVFVYSRAGYGASDPTALPRPLDYMTREAIDVLPKVLDAVGIERCVLVGHSDGATIAAIYAGSVADTRVRGLVLMAPHFFTEDVGLAEIARTAEAFEQTDLAPRMAKYHQDPVATFRGWNEAWLDPAFKDWDVSEVIDYLRIPTLALQGAQDQYGTRAQIDEVASRSYAPVETALLADCRHAPHLDQPRETLRLIAEFVTRLKRLEAATVEVA